MNEQLKELEEKISYHFQDKHLLGSDSHRSYANEHRLDHNHCNERLGTQEMQSRDRYRCFLYHKYPEKPEGDLTKIRASIVCEPTLAYCAAINIQEAICFGQRRKAPSSGKTEILLFQTLWETVIGAIYLDGGLLVQKSIFWVHF